MLLMLWEDHPIASYSISMHAFKTVLLCRTSSFVRELNTCSAPRQISSTDSGKLSKWETLRQNATEDFSVYRLLQKKEIACQGWQNKTESYCCRRNYSCQQETLVLEETNHTTKSAKLQHYNYKTNVARDEFYHKHTNFLLNSLTKREWQ